MADAIQVTILGCGTSTGVPMPTCTCTVCRSRNPKNHRLRASIWVRTAGKSILIDTSTDFRQQALRHRIPRVDAVLYTHPHTDHVAGIDDLRGYCFSQKSRIPLYGNDWTATELRARYSYIFNPGPIEGGGIPLLDFNVIDAEQSKLSIAGVETIPIPVKHGSKDCVGYRIGSIAYVTDCSYIPPRSLDRMRGLSVLVLDCLRIAPHGTHFNLDQALATISEVKPRRTILTHLAHDFEYERWQKKLPKGISLAFDGVKFSVAGN